MICAAEKGIIYRTAGSLYQHSVYLTVAIFSKLKVRGIGSDKSSVLLPGTGVDMGGELEKY